MYTKPQSFLYALGSSFFWRSSGYCLSFIKHIFIATTLGLSLDTDLFYMNLSLLGILVVSWGGVINTAIIPNLVKVRIHHSYETYRQHASGIFILIILVSTILSLVVYNFSDYIANIAFGLNKSRLNKLIIFIKFSVPIVFLSLPLSVITAFLQSERQFSFINHTNFIIGSVTLVIFLLFYKQPYSLVWSYSIGYLCGFLYSFFYSRIYKFSFHNPFSKEIYRYFKLLPSLFILQGFHSINGFLDRIFVSHLPVGNISSLSYALTIVTVFPSLLNITLSLFTVISENKSLEAQWSRVNTSISLAIYYSVPITIFLLFASLPVTEFILKRGAFSQDNCQIVSNAIIYFAPNLLPTIIIGIVDCFVIVQNKIYLIVLRTIIAILVNLLLNYAFMFIFEMGVYGVALATSISSWILILLSITVLTKIGIKIKFLPRLYWIIWLVLFCLISALVFTIYLPKNLNNFTTICGYLIVIGISALLAGVLYPGDESRLIKKTIHQILVLSRII